MNPERKVAIITDSGCSIRPGDNEAKDNNITIIPLDLQIYENGQFVTYPDLNVSPEDFYRRMREGEKLPKTSGVITGRLTEVFKNLSEKAQGIISIHITSKHSAVWESAVLAKNLFHEDTRKDTRIETIDSKQVSLATWYSAEDAAQLAKKGATLEQIMAELKERLPKINLYVVLETFENLKRGGRAKEIAEAYLASLLRIFPVIGLVEGKLTTLAKTRTAQKAKETMIEMVAEAGKLAKLSVLHTNAPEKAKNLKEALAKVFSGVIPIYEAGPVLAVHAGEGAVAVAYQKA